MKDKTNDLVFQKSTFIWIAIFTAVILMIPFAAMQFTNEVNWSETDFFVMGSLLFGMASLFVLATRKTSRRGRVLLGMVFLAVFVYVWSELAVGVFTNLGS
jgi:ABC-type transport system involved in cytochrome c biogenesis permease component